MSDRRVARRCARLDWAARPDRGRNAEWPQAALAIVAVACSAVSIPLNPRQTLSEIESVWPPFGPTPCSWSRATILLPDRPPKKAA